MKVLGPKNKSSSTPSHQPVPQRQKQELLNSFSEDFCNLALGAHLDQLDSTALSNVRLEEPILSVDVVGARHCSWLVSWCNGSIVVFKCLGLDLNFTLHLCAQNQINSHIVWLKATASASMVDTAISTCNLD